MKRKLKVNKIPKKKKSKKTANRMATAQIALFSKKGELFLRKYNISWKFAKKNISWKFTSNFFA